MSRLLTGTALGLCLALCACARYRPAALDAAAVEARLAGRPTEPLAPAARGLAADPTWLPVAAHVDPSDGLTLAEALAIGLCYGPEVLEARARLGIARALLSGAGRLDDPEWFLGPRIGIEDSGFVLPGSLSFTLPLGDQLGSERGVAAASVSEARLRAAAAELDLMLAVRAAYARYATLVRTVEVMEAAVERSAGLVEHALRRRAAGEGGSVGALLAKLEREELVAGLEELRAERDGVRAAILTRIGLLADAPVDPVPDPVALVHPAGDGADRTQEHPELLVARAAFDVAEQELRRAVAARHPTLRLGTEVELDRGDLEVGAGAGGNLPISARHAARVAEARARRDLARRHYEGVRLALSARASGAAARLASARRRLAAATERTTDIQEAQAVLESRIAAGEIDLLEALTTQGAVARARVRELALQELESLAALDLAAARGLLRGVPSEEVSK